MSNEPQKQVEMTRNTVAGGKPVKVGQKVTLPAKEAQFLIHLGKAKVVEAAAAPAPAAKKAAPAAEKSPFDAMKIGELKGFAATHEIKLPANAKKDQIVALIKAAMAAKETADNGDLDQDDQAEADDLPENQP